MSDDTSDAIPYILALATTEQLLDELVRRNALIACSATILMDGRQVTASLESGMTLAQINAHLEVRALEVMSRAMATSALKDRVHSCRIEPAHGDYAPGSKQAIVEMLAVATVGLGIGG
jgi:hypothetical protein